MTTTAAQNPVARTTFTLKYPVLVQGTTWTDLKLRRPKVRDTRILIDDADRDPVGAEVKFIANLAEVPPTVIEELDLEDMKPLREFIKGFTKSIE